MNSPSHAAIDWRDADWDKGGGLLPAIIQDAASGQVLMLGYMNREAADATVEKGLVTFFSRSKQRLWTKGESSVRGPVSAMMCRPRLGFSHIWTR